jgi:hypothetical protein
MKFKTFALFLFSFILLIFISEGLNYLTDPHSEVSVILNTFFINRSISYAKDGNFEKSIDNLFIASKINVLGEFGPYHSLSPSGNYNDIDFGDDQALKNSVLLYLGGLTKNDLNLPEDQGLGRIFYNLALISSEKNHPELTEKLLRLSMYNNPQFASFHAELINYYFSIGDNNDVGKEIDYCFQFKDSKPLCEMYSDDSIKNNKPKDIGYMRAEVERHYLTQ